MRHPKRVEIVYCCGQLVGNFSSALLADNKVTSLQIREAVATLKTLHHNVYVVVVFKNVIEPNNTGMLAQFEHFNFPLEHFQVSSGLSIFLDNFYGDFLAGESVDGLLHHSVFALS